MIITARTHIQNLLNSPTKAQRKEAAEYLQTVTPYWDADSESLMAVHPGDGLTYQVEIQDCNGSLGVHFSLGDDSELVAHLDDGYGDWSDTQLIAIFACCPGNCVFFVSDDFRFEWK